MREHCFHLYYAVTYGHSGQFFGLEGVFDAEVSDPGAAQGGEISAGTGEGQGVDGHGTGLSFDAHAAAVEFVEAGSFAFQGGGHRRDLEEVAGEFSEGCAEG